MAMKAEWDYIVDSKINFPIVKTSHMDEFAAIMRRANSYETVKDMTSKFKEAEQDKIKYYFQTNRDLYFDTIDDLISQYTTHKYPKMWAYAELCKVDDLSPIHFKYLQWKLGLREGWNVTAYKNYINGKAGW